jgi:hypothetical protein
MRVIAGGFIVADQSASPLWPAFVTGAIGGNNGDQMDAMDPRTGEWEPYPSDDVSAAFKWDLVIAHPPCTYLSNSGIHWNTRRPERAVKTEEGAGFFMEMLSLLNAHAGRWAIENPIGVMSTRWRKPDQIIHPYMFGDDASKSTCLWLSGLPVLTPTNRIPGRIVDGKERWANQTDSGQNRLPPSKDRWKIRSKTFQGIANAMADQWGRP